MNRETAISMLLIVILSFASYFNIFNNEFVWDDHIFILDNSDIRSFSNLPLFFTHDVDGLYRPLRSLYYTIIYSLAGKNEFLYHLNSLFFHTAISILIFFIIFEITNKKGIALLASLIFTAHPIHTERVTNITGSFDMLGIFFMLLSLYLYIKFSKLGNKKHFLFSLLSFLIAVFSSEEAITLPLIIILYEFCFNREKWNKRTIKDLIRNYYPFFAIALLYVIIRFFVIGIRGRVEEYLAGNFFLTFLTMLKVYIYYIYLLIFPIGLTLFRDVEAATSLLDFNVLISALALAAIIIATIRHCNNKILFFSVFWFFITLIPMSNILPLQVFMAERYLYIPSIAFSLLASYVLSAIFNLNFKNKNIARIGVAVFVVLLMMFYVFSTVNRNKDWKDNLTLWSKTVATNPNNSRAHDNLGFAYELEKDEKKALEEFELAVKLQPDNFRALGNLGVAYAKFKRYNESIAVLERSVKIRNYHKTYDKLGLVYLELGAEDKAIESFKEAIKINKRYAKAHNDLATVYAKTGEFSLAMDEFEEAIKIDKDYADAHYNLGILFEFLRDNEQARKEFEIAYALEPENELYKSKVDW